MSDSSLTAKVDLLEKQLRQSHRHLELLTKLAGLATEPGGVGYLVRRSLEIISRSNDWALGQFWLAKPNDNITYCSDWYFSSAILTDLRTASVERRLSKGVELPGRVWSTGLPVIIPEIESESGLSFTRKSAATACGIKSAFGFAIKNGPFVMGIFEFLSYQTIQIDNTDNLYYEKLGVYMAKLIAQREADHATHQQEILNKEVLNQAYNAFIAINETSLITDWTSKAAELFGWEKDEVIGKPLAEIIIPERYRDAHIKGLFRYMNSKEGPILNKPVQAPAMHKNGSEIPIELRVFPIEGLETKRFGAFIVDRSREPEEAQIKLS